MSSAVAAENHWTFTDPPDWIAHEFKKIRSSYGVKPEFYYEATVLGNPVGGLGQGVAYSHEMSFGATLELDKLMGIKGASLGIYGAQGAGRNLSETIGNTFNVSQAYVTTTTVFYELYWKQKLWDDAVVFRLGRINSAGFASLPAFGLQVNSGVDGNPTSLFLNTNFTSLNNATWGGEVTVNPSSTFYLSAGVFQATNRIGKNAYHGLDFSIRPNDGLLFFSEMGWTPKFFEATSTDHKGVVKSDREGLPGVYKVGAYYSTLPYERFNGDGYVQNTFGFYWMGQQMVWRSVDNENINISLWGGLTYSPQGEVAEMPLMGFGGFIWQGLIPGRENDQLLGAVISGTFSSEYADSVATPETGRPTFETVLDFSYVINLTDNVFIQPDIQYVILPNGLSSTPNALVIGMQFGVSF